jgi:hypothetical protein
MTKSEATFIAEIERIRCEREGAVAENMQRASVGSSMAYDEDCFLQIAKQVDLALQKYLSAGEDE